MTVSEQIISVLNALCEKFGVAVDWTAANVLPYAKDLCGRIITYSIASNIATIVFLIVGLIIVFFVFKFFFKKGLEDDWVSDGWSIGSICTGILFGLFCLACLFAIPHLALDIIQACTIPELTIIKTIEGLVESKG